MPQHPLELALMAAGLAAVAAWLGGQVAGRRLSGRLRELGRVAGYIAAGDLSQRVAETPAGEIGELGWQVNRLAAQLASGREALRELTERNAELAAAEAAHAALAERTRLARELHDTVNQQLFSLNMQAATAERRLAEAASGPEAEAVRQSLRQVSELARSVHAEMRALILQLRPVQDSGHGLAAALPAYVSEWSRRTGIAADCEVSADAGPLAGDAEDELYRIAQESLSNVARHAGADQVRVRLEPAWGGTRLRVTDNGRGFTPEVMPGAGSFGLRGMAERARALGADLRIKSSPGAGAEIEVWLPPPARQEGT